MKTCPNPRPGGQRLVADGTYEGRSAEEINADFYAMCADPGYAFGYIPSRPSEPLPLATQQFLISFWRQTREGRSDA